ncbi:MAG TPA: hypothetical protein VJ914_31295 [Pseudonocardiaceae bacterium]|nr:hypothetical protein [Pseudonocardiaceae bacterium]
MTTLSDLESAKVLIEMATWTASSSMLAAAIENAITPPAPTGSPSAINGQAAAYAKTAAQCGLVAKDIDAVATRSLPEAWHGAVAETAAQAVQAVGADVQNVQLVLDKAVPALEHWAQTLAWAQATDTAGLAVLNSAKSSLGFLGFEVWNLPAAAQQALDGVNMRIAAASAAQTTGTSTASLLNQLADQARAERIAEDSMDPLSAVVLAGETNPGGSVDGGKILTENQLARGSQVLDGMSAADRATFQQLLAQCQSPQEAAYLWKALAAGHSLNQVQQFDAAIHPHGNDPAWLAGHLTPAFEKNNSNNGTNGTNGSETTTAAFLTYQGQQFGNLDSHGWGIYDQGGVNDCVAASTVVAQANVDPITMLNLTTGGTANGDDSPAAFHQRMQNMFVQNYIEGQKADGDSHTYPKEDSGLGSSGETVLANQDLGPSTGSQYHYVSLDNDSDRQNALPGIEQAVDAGKPVPIDVTNGKEGHQLMIIGHDGDKLEVYNPWGYTSWVTESQFLNNQLGSLTTTAGDGSLKTADGLELPQ